MKFILITPVFILISLGFVMAQRKFSTLRVGDTVPDMPLRFLKPEDKDLKFSDYRGKNIIVDFWATWCAPCIAGIPKVHEMKRKHDADLQVLLVNDGEQESNVERFVSKRENVPNSKITLPVIFGDSLLTKVIFAHSGLPTYFWVDRKGVLKYKTSSLDLTEKNVESFIKNGAIDLYNDQRMYSASESSLNRDVVFWKTELGMGNVNGPTAISFKNSGESKIFCFNNSPIDLYRFAYGEFHEGSQRDRSFVLALPFNRVLFEATKKSNNAGRHYLNKRQADSLYSYEMTAPDYCSWPKMSEAMIGDLDNWFGYETSIEKRNVKYLSLTISDTTQLAKASGKGLYRISDVEFCLNNLTINQFLRRLNDNIEDGKFFLYKYPIVDESDFKGRLGRICVENVDTSNPELLDKALSTFGIRLQLKERPIDMLVIRDKGESQ